MLKEIDFLANEYEEILVTEKAMERSNKNFSKHFNIGDGDYKREQLNPFRYQKVTDSLKEIRDKFLDVVSSIFTNRYPNVSLDGSYFEDCVETKINKYDNKVKSLKIDFSKVKEKLKVLIKDADKLAEKELLKQSLHLIPYELTGSYGDKRKFKKEELIKGTKLQLYCGWSYDSPNKSNVGYFLKLLNVVLCKVEPSTAQEYDLHLNLKYFKNGRLDVELSNNDKVLAIAEYLEKHQEKPNN